MSVKASVYMPRPKEPYVIRVEIEATAGDQLKQRAFAAGLAVSSYCRIVSELMAREGKITERSLASEIQRRREVSRILRPRVDRDRAARETVGV